MYTKNPQVRNSWLNYSHSSINLSFDVLDGLFRQCPFYVNMLTAGSCTIVLLLWKKIHFLKCCIFSESHQFLVTRVALFGSSPHYVGPHYVAKCIAKLYAVYIAGAWQSLRKKYFFELSTHFQFNHSDSFILSRQVLCWPCFDRFSSYGFDFLLFNYMLLSA